MLATHFLDELTTTLKYFVLNKEGIATNLVATRGATDEETYNSFIDKLAELETKRIMFDSRQALLFDQLNEPFPADFLSKLRLPFKQFYLEFTEPVKLGEQEQGHIDYARAMLFVPNVGLSTVISPDGKSTLLNLHSLTLFLKEEGDKVLVDRTFKFVLERGWSVTNKRAASENPDPSDLPDEWLPDTYFVCGATGRYQGWWERVCMDYSSLFCWVLAYMMAKSVHIEAEAISRQVRRWHEQHKEPLPEPWHIVQLDPKVLRHAQGEESDRHVNYRFDVVGHLRFQHQFLRSSGEHKDIIEWVSPHQRGLGNELYIPKTYSVEANRKIAVRQMKQYFGR